MTNADNNMDTKKFLFHFFFLYFGGEALWRDGRDPKRRSGKRLQGDYNKLVCLYPQPFAILKVTLGHSKTDRYIIQ